MIKIEQNAKFFDISNIINPEYDKFGYITENMIISDYQKRVKKYIYDNKLKFGDIIFIGSKKRNNQELGFQIVLENGNSNSSDDPYYLPLEIKNIKFKLKNYNIKYKNLFDNIKNDNKINNLFHNEINYYEIVNEYIDAGIWN